MSIATSDTTVPTALWSSCADNYAIVFNTDCSVVYIIICSNGYQLRKIKLNYYVEHKMFAIYGMTNKFNKQLDIV